MSRLIACLCAVALLSACETTPTGTGVFGTCGPRVYNTPTGPITIPHDSVCH